MNHDTRNTVPPLAKEEKANYGGGALPTPNMQLVVTYHTVEPLMKSAQLAQNLSHL